MKRRLIDYSEGTLRRWSVILGRTLGRHSPLTQVVGGLIQQKRHERQTVATIWGPLPVGGPK